MRTRGEDEMEHTTATGSHGGRPSLLNHKRQEQLCDFIRGGVLPARAATAVGISKSTFYDWTAKGRAAATKRAAGERLASRDQRFLVLWTEIERAKVAAEEWALAQMRAAATPHLRRRVVRTLQPVCNAQGPVLGPDGMPLMRETVMEEETEVVHWRSANALLARLDRRQEREELAPEETSDTPTVDVGGLERRLAETVRARRLDLERDQGPAAMPDQWAPTSRAAPTTDDDGIDYMYAPWVALMNAYGESSEPSTGDVDDIATRPI
jgi:hypothetical protein